MPPPQTLGVPQIEGETVDELRQSTQFWLQETFNHLDQIIGARGTPTFLGNINANGNRIQSLGLPIDPTDVQRVDRCLHLDDRGDAFDAQGKAITGLPFTDKDDDAISLAQVEALLDESELGIKDAAFVVAVASSDLTSERTLDAESGVLSITDNGANGTIEIGVVAAGLSDVKLTETYAILTGRPGGQTFQGDTASGGDLALDSTSHATKGDVLIQTGGGGVGIGATPGASILGIIQTDSEDLLHLSNAGTGGLWQTLTTNATLRGYLGVGDTTGGSAIFTNELANAVGLRSQGALHLGSGTVADFTIDTGGQVGIGTVTPGSLLELNLATEDLEIVNAGSAAATQQDWIEVQVGGNTGYIHVFAAA